MRRVGGFAALLALAAALLAHDARAGAWEAAEALKSGDYAAAKRECETAAKAGDASCQTLMGVLYQEGKGVPANPAEAVRWFRLAAEQGSASAAADLGLAYENGRGVAKNPDEAEKWYRIAAQKGLPQGQFLLGVLIVSRHRDVKDALKLFRLAAAQGLSEAQAMLGEAYERGAGVKPNPKTAAKWFEAAAERGLSDAQSRLAYLYERGEGVEMDLQEAYFWHAVALRDPHDPHRGQDEAALRRLAGRLTKEQVAEAAQAAREFQVKQSAAGTSGRRSRKRQAEQSCGVPGQPLRLCATGSGFFVTRQGHLVTNNHVVAACREVRVTEGEKGTPVKVLATDPERDLALLQLPHPVAEFASFRGADRPRPGESIVVLGFPLSGLLSSDAIVTTGIISALAGTRDNRREMQISAPIQPGNSGGPVLDASGNIVGVAVASLNALKIAQVTGAIPENVNFAVKGEEAQQFLAAHGVAVSTGKAAAKELSAAAIADRALKLTVRIECWK